MSATLKHTPIPWSFKRNSGPREVTLKRDHFSIGVRGGRGVAIVFGPEQGDEAPTDGNARLIVRAVNAHADLLALAERVAYHFENQDHPIGDAARDLLQRVQGGA